MEKSTNPYASFSEQELLQKYMSESPPNELMIQNTFRALFTKQIWDNTVATPADIENLKGEISRFMDELINYQESLGAAITAVNNQNKELGKLLK